MKQGDGPALAAVDWGTSNLRIWLLDERGEILGQRRSGEGMTSAGGRGYSKILEEHLAALGCPPGIPAVVCGMAGARQGWMEAGYLDVPASTADFANASTPVPGTSRPVRILPGLAQRSVDSPDVMRGEETQIAGAGLGAGHHLVCMPGTHSKWVRVEDGVVTGFDTAMTGELFHVIAAHSILRHAVGDDPDAGEASSPAFADGLRRALAAPDRLTAALFAIRAGGLLAGLSKQDAAARLSGLLIGAEIAGARSVAAGASHVTLVASGALAERYRIALDVAGFSVRLVDAEIAARRGLFEAGSRLFLSDRSA